MRSIVRNNVRSNGMCDARSNDGSSEGFRLRSSSRYSEGHSRGYDEGHKARHADGCNERYDAGQNG